MKVTELLLKFLEPTRIKLVLLLPGIGFLLAELLLEPAALKAALPGLFILAALYYLAASLAITWHRGHVRVPRFSILLGLAAFLVALDQGCKRLVLHQLPLEAEQMLIPGAITLTHTHNLRGSWVASELNLDFVSTWILSSISVLFTILALSLYRYYLARRGRRAFWAGIALVGFVAGLSSAFVDLAIRGFTVDYLDVAGLVVADLKDFYLDIALAAFFAEVAENYDAARRMSNRQLLCHLKQALALSAQELTAQFPKRHSGPSV